MSTDKQTGDMRQETDRPGPRGDSTRGGSPKNRKLCSSNVCVHQDCPEQHFLNVTNMEAILPMVEL